MRDYGDSANMAKSHSLALQGAMFGVVLMFLSMISIRLWRFEAALTFLPLIAVFLWPRGASFGLSAFLIFLLGLGVDILSGGPVGLWALIYLCGYGILRPDLRTGESNWRQVWLFFLGWVISAVVMVAAIGALAIEGVTAYWPLVLQAITALILFPFIYAVRQGLRSLIHDSDDPRVTG